MQTWSAGPGRSPLPAPSQLSASSHDVVPAPPSHTRVHAGAADASAATARAPATARMAAATIALARETLTASKERMTRAIAVVERADIAPFRVSQTSRPAVFTAWV